MALLFSSLRFLGADIFSLEDLLVADRAAGLREIARELPGFSPPVCVCCVVLLFFFTFALLYSYLFHAHTTIRSTSSTSTANDAILGRLSSCAIFFNEEFRKVQWKLVYISRLKDRLIPIWHR
ncbi:hypothetical protein Q3G72_003122 [Acer saccharum]|nr:hypothetical protein Q3G72_003122 [Acer saccharum]